MTLKFIDAGKSQGTKAPFSTSTGLSTFWQSRIASITGEIEKQLLPKEHGQLKRLKESLGSNRAREVIDFAITHWQEFAQKAAENAGVKAFPDKPHVGFLLKYHATALAMMLDELQLIAKKQAQKQQMEQQAKAAEKAAKLKIVEKPVVLIELTEEQINALHHGDETYDPFFEAITAKHGENWRPAKWNEIGIPSGVALKLAG